MNPRNGSELLSWAPGCILVAVTDLLSLADVHVFYGNATGLVDLTTAKPFAQISKTGTGTIDQIRAVSDDDVELIVLSTGVNVVASAYFGDRLALLDTISGAGGFYVEILQASSRGMVLPATVQDPISGGSVQTAATNKVIMTTVQFAQRAPHTSINGATEIPVGGTQIVQTSSPVWAVTTSVGAINGVDQVVGINKLAVAADEMYRPTAGWTGWMLEEYA